jgi:hypothetical protein
MESKTIAGITVMHTRKIKGSNLKHQIEPFFVGLKMNNKWVIKKGAIINMCSLFGNPRKT